MKNDRAQLSNLATQLQEDAVREVPPFGAESVKTARQLGSSAMSLLMDEVSEHGKVAFLALEALRAADQHGYASVPVQKRAQIYADALRNGTLFNAWGLPGYQLTPTADALISLGAPAISALQPLLTDRRPAPLAGSQDAKTSEMYGNRVSDYAWVLINEIQGRPYTYSQDPAERDRAIEALQHELECNGGRT